MAGLRPMFWKRILPPRLQDKHGKTGQVSAALGNVADCSSPLERDPLSLSARQEATTITRSQENSVPVPKQHRTIPPFSTGVRALAHIRGRLAAYLGDYAVLDRYRCSSGRRAPATHRQTLGSPAWLSPTALERPAPTATR